MPRTLVIRITPKDCRLDTFPAGGPGGQNQNKRDTGARWTHLASGAVGESRTHRTQLQNKRAAWARMGNSKKFQQWARLQAAGAEKVDATVTELMNPRNLKIEVRVRGTWEVIDG